MELTRVYSIVTTPTYNATGNIQPFDDTYVINNATFNGDSANDNSFEDNCSNIRVIGPSGAGLKVSVSDSGSTLTVNTETFTSTTGNTAATSAVELVFTN